MSNQYRIINIDEVKRVAKSKGITLIDKIYTNIKSQMKFKCDRCRTHFETSFESLNQSKYGCRKCSIQLKERLGGKKPRNNRPKSNKEWSELFQGYNLTFVGYKNSIPDKTGRVYKMVGFKCNNCFEIDGSKHPEVYWKVTNIERNISRGSIKCPYCSSANYVSPPSSPNHEKDKNRLKLILEAEANRMGAKLTPNQDFSSVKKKFEFTKGSETKMLEGSILIRLKLDPFSRGERLNKKFSTPYSALEKAARTKGFKLLINEREYNQLIKLDRTGYSPSTRTIPFEFLGETCEAPIGRITSKGWLPKSNKVKEEISRYFIETILDAKFPSFRPESLVGVKNVKLEIDCYNQDVHGWAIAVEHQGKQHYNLVYNKRFLPTQQQNDKIKKEWCEANNVIFIEIPDIGTMTPLEEVPQFILTKLKNQGFPSELTHSIDQINYKELYCYVTMRLKVRIKRLKDRYKQYGIKLEVIDLQKTSLRFKVKLKSGLVIFKAKGITILERASDSQIRMWTSES